jgi:epoxyqueuosine reductase
MELTASDIKKTALSLGFSACGIAKAIPLIAEKQYFTSMIDNGAHANLAYLERDIEVRFSPELLLPGCKSVIVFLYNYLTGEKLEADYKIAKYAYINDYHLLIKNKLERVVEMISRTYPEAHCKITVDSANITEKNWAVKAGLGYIGKNSLLQTDNGSFFLIGTILTDVVFEYDTEKERNCGSCMRCVEACPVHAITKPYQVDVRKCLSFHTIENKETADDSANTYQWVFGCDVCQDICPNNKNSKPNPDTLDKFSLFLHFKNSDFENLTKEEFENCFRDSCVKRRKYEKFTERINKVKIELNSKSDSKSE